VKDQPVRSVAKEDILLFNVGIASMKAISILKLLLLRSLLCTLLILLMMVLGFLTLQQQLTSPIMVRGFNASRPLERVHCDLWGPAPVSSVQGFQYYVIFIDNLSRFCWFYPLKRKSDFCSIFIKFQSLVENLLQTKIGTFQSDGGGEFISQRFLKHLQDSGIQHFISCPHTPLQNGMAERKT